MTGTAVGGLRQRIEVSHAAVGRRDGTAAGAAERTCRARCACGLADDRVEGSGGAEAALICADDGVGAGRAYSKHIDSI